MIQYYIISLFPNTFSGMARNYWILNFAAKEYIYILSWNSKGHLVSQHRKIDLGPQSYAGLIADNALSDYKILTVMVLGTYDMHIYILY